MNKKPVSWLLAFFLMAGYGQASAQVREIAQIAKPISTKKGTLSFSSQFRNTASGRSDINAYLLCYLSTLVYPQYLSIVAQQPSDAYVDRLHTKPDDFKKEFVRHTSHLFPSPDYQFIHESFPTGYDPEAMIISTAQTIYVVFRGTDRVASNRVESFMYDWGEWIGSDFDARYLNTPELTGNVLAGMWLSLTYNNFKEKVLEAIRQKGGQAKKVWITGHSLGAGQAQLLAMYLAKKGIAVQGVYAYAAPHPGTQEFVTELERLLPNGRLQRFDFINDPITALAPYSLGYQRAGTRVYYNDINSIQFGAPERSPAEAAALLPGINGAIGNAIADFVSEKSGRRLKLDILSPGGSPICYHHPLWYLRAAYSQLTAEERSAVPSPLPLPEQSSEGCDLLTVQRGKTANPAVIARTLVKGAVEAGVESVKESLEKLSFTATTIMDNITGNAITPGDYYIRPYAAEGRLGLNEQDGIQDGSRLKLTTARSKVKIERYGAAGYTIRFGVRTVTSEFFGVTTTETKEYVLDCNADDLFDENSSSIQLWQKNGLPALSANQRWLFIRLKDNKYLIKNVANGKLLDAHNDCLDETSCGVKTYRPQTNDQTQIWIVEKAD
ncbi:MAG TPA: hypothetical protein VFR58_10780 [Flavisolibacter sp.]|nr:hypothetical protein [Flavisolibacter sp.]